MSRQEGLLNIKSDGDCNYYLVLTGPKGDANGSRDQSNPFRIDEVYLFRLRDLIHELQLGGTKVGTASSVRKDLWKQSQVYPFDRNPHLTIGTRERDLLRLFSPDSDADVGNG